MNRYEITYTVGTEYIVTIDAYSIKHATETFEELYDGFDGEIETAREQGVTHHITHIARGVDIWKNFDRSFHLVRGIGADNRLQVIAVVNDDGQPVYRVEEISSSFESILCEDFGTIGGAITRANALLVDEENVSGIKQERF